MIALITDLHLGIMKNSDEFIENQINFIKKQFIPYLITNKIKKVFIMGDVFDNRNSVNTKTHNTVFDLFHDDFKPFDVTVLVGNHDSYFNNTIEINSIKFLSKFKNIKVIDKITVDIVDDKKILLVPWIVNPADFILEVNKLEEKSFDVCLGHFHFNGFNFNKVKLSDEGINNDIISNKCKKIFTGHFHTRSKQIHNGCEIVYIGSPYQLTKADINEDRGFVILNTDTLDYKFINNIISSKFISIQYPSIVTKEMVEGNIIDIRVKYNDTYNEKSIDEYIKNITELKPLFSPNIVIENDEISGGELDLGKIKFGSILELLKEYTNTLEIENKEDIVKILINLYNEIKGEC